MNNFEDILRAMQEETGVSGAGSYQPAGAGMQSDLLKMVAPGVSPGQSVQSNAQNGQMWGQMMMKMLSKDGGTTAGSGGFD